MKCLRLGIREKDPLDGAVKHTPVLEPAALVSLRRWNRGKMKTKRHKSDQVAKGVNEFLVLTLPLLTPLLLASLLFSSLLFSILLYFYLSPVPSICLSRWVRIRGVIYRSSATAQCAQESLINPGPGSISHYHCSLISYHTHVGVVSEHCVAGSSLLCHRGGCVCVRTFC